MDRTDAVADATTSEALEPTSDQVPPALAPSGARRALVPYLVVAVLGLMAALIVVAQLWAYRDELRTILTQTPV